MAESEKIGFRIRVLGDSICGFIDDEIDFKSKFAFKAKPQLSASLKMMDNIGFIALVTRNIKNQKQ